jgi:hypothetical protein
MSDKLIKTGFSVEIANAFAENISHAIEETTPEVEKCKRCGHAKTAHAIVETKDDRAECYFKYASGSTCGCRLFSGDVLAIVEVQPSTVPSLFAEGKHFCKLRRVYYDTSRTGNPMVGFVLEVVKSQQIATGVEVVHALPVRTGTEKRITLRMVNRLGIDPLAITGMLENLDIEVVVVVVKKWTKAKIDGSQREVTSTWMRRPDDTDVEPDFGPDFDNE